jgi:hypothetical protein
MKDLKVSDPNKKATKLKVFAARYSRQKLLKLRRYFHIRNLKRSIVFCAEISCEDDGKKRCRNRKDLRESPEMLTSLARINLSPPNSDRLSVGEFVKIKSA